MSWQTQTAVNHYSKQKNMDLFRLLMYLAEGADSEGVIDPAPSQDTTLAEFCGCSDRTVRTRLKALIDSGELIQTRVGSGPGNPSAYKITLTMSSEGGRKVEEIPVVTSTFDKAVMGLMAEVEALKVEVLGLKVEVSALKVEKVEAKGGNPVNELDADDPYFDPYDPEEEIKNPPTPQTDEEVEQIHDALMGYIATFEQSTGLRRPRQWRNEKHDHRELFLDKWFSPVKNMKALANGHTEDLMRLAVDEMTAAKLTIGSPASIYTTFCRLHREGTHRQADNPYANDVSNGKGW